MYVHLTKCTGRLAIIGLILLLPIYSLAQTHNLYDIVNAGLHNYPLLKVRQAELNAAKAHVTTVKGNHLPSLKVHDQLTLGTGNGIAGSYFPLGMVPSTSGTVTQNDMSAIGGNIAISLLEWEFYNFGYNKAQTQNAKAAYNTQQAALNSDTYLLTQRIVSLYLDFLKKYKLMNIEFENEQRANVVFQSIRANVSSGLKPGVDSNTAKAETIRAHINYLKAKDEYVNDEIELYGLTGLDTASLKPDTTLFNVAFNAALLKFAFTDSIAQEHPMLDLYQKELQQSITEQDVLKKKYAPKLSILSAAWMRGNSLTDAGSRGDITDGLAYSRYNYLTGLTFTYNLFDIKHRHDQVVEGRYKTQAADQMLQEEKIALDDLLQKADQTYASTTEILDNMPAQLNAAQQAYAQQLALYRSGLNTLVDVTNALYELRQAEADYVYAQDQMIQVLYIRAGLNNRLDDFLKLFKS